MIIRPSNYETLTVTNTVAGSLQNMPSEGNVPLDMIGAFIIVEDNDVRFRADGTDPTTTEGFLFVAGGAILYLTESGPFLAALRFIATTGTANIRVQYTIQ